MYPNPSPKPNNMGSDSSMPICFKSEPVAVVSQCLPTNGLMFLIMFAKAVPLVKNSERFILEIVL